MWTRVPFGYLQKRTDRKRPLRQAGPILLLTLLCLGIWAGVGAGPAVAQGAASLLSAVTGGSENEASTPAEPASQGALEAAARDGSGDTMQTMDRFADEAVRARDILKAIVQKIPTVRAAMLQTLRGQGGDEGLRWVSSALLDVFIAAVLGLAASLALARWGRRQFAGMYKPNVYSRADKITYLYLRALLMIVCVGLYFIVATVVYLLIGSGLEAANQTALVVFSMSSAFLALRIVWLNLLAPDAESHRLVALTNREASGLYRALIGATAISAVAIAFCLWMDRLGLPEDIHKLALIAASGLSMILLSAIAIAYRSVIGRLIRGQNENPVMWRRVLAAVWHLAAVIYFVIAWAISALRILLDLPSATGLVAAPIQVLLAAAVAYGVLILVIDRILLPRLDTAKVEAKIAEDIQRTEESEGVEQDLESTLAQAHAEAADREADRSPFRALLDRGAAILVVFGALDLLTSLWGVGMAGNQSVIGSFIEVLLVMFLGYMAYEAVKILIDRQIAKEAPAEKKDEEAEIGGAGESRISTLLPIFRNFLLITIVVIAAMVVLSELGVNIAPLFAGAGVVGLAVGFGAQTLIRDIFSGAFYLIDDAFRKGEYIDIGSAKGTVEKISIRSMQLRHHRGALTTVPFGEIQQVQNYSRDWAIMKLAFRVTYDTDVEKMRKIIKKFGQRLLEDEYYGSMFLAPLKSQGIMSMEDSAMIARVKFTAKPGKQFELRKVIYAGLRDLFEQNGIRFAHRQVTVRVAGAGDEEDEANGKVSPEVAKAAAGAAAMSGILDEEAASGNGQDDPI